MRIERTDRIDRLLARHRDIVLVDGLSGNGALIRDNQLLAVGGDAGTVDERAARWIDRRDDDNNTGVSVFHLRPRAGVDVCELSTELSGGTRHKRVNAGPNHIVTTQPFWSPSPFDDPEPAGAIPAPGESTVQGDVTVAILDTGISEHPWFAKRKWFADCDADVREVPDSDHDDQRDSVAGHGTFIAGVVLKHAPDAHLVISRVVSGDGVTDERDLLRGLAALRRRAQSTGKQIDVVSLSLGCYTHDDKPSPALAHGLNAFDRHTVIVACAGNAGSDRPFWPAALKRVVAVAALDANGRDRAEFSNYGWWVDACAIGDKVVSSFFTYDAHTPTGEERFDGYAAWSGTSFAAPNVAGVIAAYAAQHGFSASRAAAIILDPSNHPSMPDLGVLVDAARPSRRP